VLQIGTVSHYNAAALRSIVYTAPTTGSEDAVLTQTYTVTQSIEQAAAGAPGPIDVHNVFAYTLTHDPGEGTVPVTQTTDTFRGVGISGSNQTVSTYGQNIALVANDETSDAEGGGPYTMSTTTATTYPAPLVGLTYPLVTGATLTLPAAASQKITQTDVNAGNAVPPTGLLNFAQTQLINNDGSFTFTKIFPAQGTEVRTENSNGSGTDVATLTTGTVAETIGLPTAGTIPVSVTATPAGGTAKSTAFSAADWYPSGVVSSPLSLETMTVIGPTATLPVTCDGAIAQPNIVEVDQVKHTLDVFGSYVSSTTRLFISNGLTVCQLATSTSANYDIRTGALFSTINTTNIQVLAATTFVNAASSLRSSRSTHSTGGVVH